MPVMGHRGASGTPCSSGSPDSRPGPRDTTTATLCSPAAPPGRCGPSPRRRTVRVVHRSRLLSDNGLCYVSQALGSYLTQHGLTHTRGAPHHPMTQGKIERYHRSMKNVVKLDVYHSPWELERAIGRFVEHYNHRRLHESLQNVTPADMYAGRQGAILNRRARIKRATLARRKRENLRVA